MLNICFFRRHFLRSYRSLLITATCYPFFLVSLRFSQVIDSEPIDSIEVDVVGIRPETSAQVRSHLWCLFQGDSLLFAVTDNCVVG